MHLFYYSLTNKPNHIRVRFFKINVGLGGPYQLLSLSFIEIALKTDLLTFGIIVRRRHAINNFTKDLDQLITSSQKEQLKVDSVYLKQRIAETREECVEICDNNKDGGSYDTYPLVDRQDGWNRALDFIAAAIRDSK